MALFDLDGTPRCECGCGKEVNWWTERAQGHHNKTSEARDRLSKNNCMYDPEVVGNLVSRAVEVNRGRIHTSEEDSKRSTSMLRYYETHPERAREHSLALAGKPHAPEHCINLGKAKTRWCRTHPDEVKAAVEAMIAGQGRHPNNTEVAVLDLLEQFWPGEWEYVGDGKLWIGSETTQRNPDFVNRTKIALIESNGYFWHGPSRMSNETLVEFYNSYGYKCLVIEASVVNEVPLCCLEILDFCNSLKVGGN
jgi:hypothetical protein